MKIEIIPCLQDNYSYLIIDETNNNACVIDPSEANPVINFLEKKKIKPNIQIKKEFNTFYVITLSGKNARSIASCLYKGAPPLGRLDRKYDLYLQWKKRRRKIFFSQ